ncbi:hypothetical protein [Sulfurimonas sp. CS5]|jgi:hypothetical protein|uniref:hypothetical protein n=1 Tax=Sulfurimonas sp. CS5 TaxID=3391145 RepID=UPI0039E8F794
MSEEKSGMSLVKKAFIFGLLSAFLIMGILSMKRAMPEEKNERIYKAFKVHSPYQLEKRMGGLTILNLNDPENKEKPSAAEVLHRLDELDQEWAKDHLSVENNTLLISKENNTTIEISIETPKERAFIKSFFGI